MDYNKLFIFIIIASFVLHSMEKENKQSSNSLKSKVKAITSSISNSLKLSSSTPKIVKHPIKLTKILQLKLSEITVLEAGQEIEVTNQAIKRLKELFIVFYTTDKEKKFILPNKQNHTIKETGIYIVRNDSDVNKEYLISEIETYYGPKSYAPIKSFKKAHHIEFYKIKVKHKKSIFKPYYQGETMGYDLDLVYDEHPTKQSWAFELKENNTPVIIRDSSVFEGHADRITKCPILTDPKTAPLDILLSLQRH